MNGIDFWRTDHMKVYICSCPKCQKEGTSQEKFVEIENKTYCIDCAKKLFFGKQKDGNFVENYIG